MKQLENTFERDNNKFSQMTRNDKTALYVRKTFEDTFVCYEVFAVKTMNDEEIYPLEPAFGKCAWAPKSIERAQTYFDRISKGEIVIPDINPLTGEMIPLVNDPSLDEMMAEAEIPVTNVVETIPAETVAPVVVENVITIPVETVAEPVIDVPIVIVNPVESTVTQVETTETVTAPSEIVPIETVAKVDVTPTNDGGALVTVAKVKKNKVEMVIPLGEFTQAQFAIANNLPVRGVVWSRLDFLVNSGKLNKSFRKVGKGKPTAFYVGV